MKTWDVICMYQLFQRKTLSCCTIFTSIHWYMILINKKEFICWFSNSGNYLRPCLIVPQLISIMMRRNSKWPDLSQYNSRSFSWGGYMDRMRRASRKQIIDDRIENKRQKNMIFINCSCNTNVIRLYHLVPVIRLFSYFWNMSI